jgi:hypothetical protein
MTRKGIVVSAALTLLSAAAHAGSAPKELYGKSIVVAWSESRDQRVETEKEVRNFGQAVQMNLYISTAGRPFSRTSERVMGGYDLRRNPGAGAPSETGPGVSSAATERVDFEERLIVVYCPIPKCRAPRCHRVERGRH